MLEHYQVTPSQIIELKALMGDSADNISGIPGVGEKTATRLIKEYGTVENAYAHAEEIPQKRARESLLEHYELAQLSRELAQFVRTARWNFPVRMPKSGIFTQRKPMSCAES